MPNTLNIRMTDSGFIKLFIAMNVYSTLSR